MVVSQAAAAAADGQKVLEAARLRLRRLGRGEHGNTGNATRISILLEDRGLSAHSSRVLAYPPGEILRTN